MEFSRQQETEDVNWLVGMIRFSEKGPVFSTQPECQLELEESSAVAVITNEPVTSVPVKTKTPNHDPLPRPELSDKARAYLLKEVAMSALLGSIAR